MQNTDILIIGGGIIGLCLSIQLKKSLPDSKITLIEKEKELGYHASGRNSGVLHAGFYYTSDSLKAKFCRQGNQLMTEYCEEHKLPINRCGKLVIATNESELSQLDVLYERGIQNNVKIEMIDAKDAKEIEPTVNTFTKALYSPTTSSVNPLLVVQQLEKDANSLGVKIQTDTKYLKTQNRIVETNQGKIQCGFIINSAGLYADKIAHEFGFARHYKILPFKGLYLYSDNYQLKTNIYPVPNINQPFLGSHFTVTVDGKTKIGPTAAPAFWREHYNLIENYNFNENIETSVNLLKLWINNPFNFRKLAHEEMQKLNKKNLALSAGKMVSNFNWKNFSRWGKPGIRAQLFNTKDNSLEMDYVYEGDKNSFHVLNAVSPAFTSSIPFSKFLCDIVLEKIN